MKFGLIVPQEFAEHYRMHDFEISGLLNWAPALDGNVYTINEDFSDRDVIMTNVSSTENEYISIIRQVLPDVKIVACFDYGFDIVGQYFRDLDRIKTVMNRADIVFSVNRNQLEWMRVLLPDKEVHYCPHPTDVDNMLKFRRKPQERTHGIAAMWHQYDNYHLQSLEVLKAVERKMGKPLQKTLIGLKSTWMQQHGVVIPTASIPLISNDYPDAKLRGSPVDPALPSITESIPPGIGWDSVMPYLGVGPWYSVLSGYHVTLDLYTINSIGRFGIDSAGVGVPCVASNKQDSSKLLWPFTVVDPYVPGPAIAFIAKLLRDDTFYSKVEATAIKNLHHFDFARSKERMMRILEEA